MKKLILALILIASPALADEPKPTFWVMIVQMHASTLNVSYPTEDACKAGLKVTGAHVKKLGVGSAFCMPVVQP